MEIEHLSLKGLKRITPDLYRDERGLFFEAYRAEKYLSMGSFVQDNVSCSRQGVLRGMHYQKGKGQAKLVQVICGKIYDVAVDIRLTSPTFGQWYSTILDDSKREQLFIPEGFAHGFCVISNEAIVSYKVSTPYCAELETEFHYSSLGIKWPSKKPILSEKDQKAPIFAEVFA